MTYRSKDFSSFAIGDAVTFSKTITEADVLLFAGVSGDTYPLHVDAEYAKNTRFGQRVAHGMLSASLLSTANAGLLGVPGGIYIEQNIRFKNPVYVGDTLTARAEVIEIITDRRRLRTHTTIVNQKGDLVIDGEAVVQKDNIV